MSTKYWKEVDTVPMLRIQPRTLDRIENFKRSLGQKSSDETVNWLCDRAEDPKAAIEALGYFLTDLRKDVKKLANLADALTPTLQKEVAK